jgi:hypothetical protein
MTVNQWAQQSKDKLQRMSVTSSCEKNKKHDYLNDAHVQHNMTFFKDSLNSHPSSGQLKKTSFLYEVQFVTAMRKEVMLLPLSEKEMP